MNAGTAVSAFSVGVAVLFAAAYGIGGAVGPVGAVPAAHADTHEGADEQESPEDGGHHQDTGQPSAPPMTAADVPGGLMVSQNGYTLVLHRTATSPGRDKVVEFSVTGPDGAPVTRYEVEHEKQLHLIAVRRTSPASSTSIRSSTTQATGRSPWTCWRASGGSSPTSPPPAGRH